MKKFICVLLLLSLVLTSCSILRPTEDQTDTPANEQSEIGDDEPADVPPADTDEPTDTEDPEEPEEPEEPEPDTQAIAAEIVGKMTLDEKIGQMLMPSARTWTDANGDKQSVTSLNSELTEALRELGLGGVILFSDNTAGTEATVGLIYDMQEAATSDGGIPLLTSVDQEGGYIVRLGTGTGFCGNMALGAANDASLTERAASVMGEELASLGFNVDFAPVLDVNNNPSNPVIGVRSFSDDPYIAADMGKAFIKGLHSANIAAALKHFPGHGDTSTDSHSGLPCIDKSLDELEACELIPFAEGINAGADMIMTAHIQYPQIEKETYTSISTGEEITLPATLSKTIITDVLREKLGFDGVVCTDAMNMGAIVDHFNKTDAAYYAISAGVDILLMPVDLSSTAGVDACRQYIADIADMVNGGKLDVSLIDSAATRIIKLKLDRGVIEMDETAEKKDRQTLVENALSVVGSAENHAIEWETTEAAVTLVKNDGALPIDLSDGGRAVVFCSYENEVNSVRYAVQKLVEDGTIPETAAVDVICYNNRSAYEFSDVITSADAVIASVESYGAADLTGGWQSGFIDALAEIVHGQGKKLTVISIQLPYDLARYGCADALLAAYSSKGMNVIPNTSGGEMKTYGPNLPAAVYSAFGGCVPRGKLPVDVPKLDEYYRFTDEILYGRGFGLTEWGK